MITFKQYLTDDVVNKWDKKRVAQNKAMQMIDEHCKVGFATAMKTGGFLYRGDKNMSQSFSLIDTTNAVRTSRDSNNLYQLMMDTSPHLKEFPSRTSSLICSASADTAKRYGGGEFNIIIPFDGVDIAFAENVHDFPHNVNLVQDGDMILSIDDFSFYLAKAMRPFTEAASSKKYTDAAALDAALSNMPPTQNELMKAYIKYALDNDRVRYIGTMLLKLPKEKRFTQLSAKMMTPRATKLELTTTANPLYAISDSECWFTGKAIVISSEQFAKILKAKIDNNETVHPELVKVFSKDMKFV